MIPLGRLAALAILIVSSGLGCKRAREAEPAFDAASQASLQDATGERVAFHKDPKRILPLSPALAELVADLLDEDLDRIIAVTERTDYPPALARKPSIGPFHHFNVELARVFKPDLALATLDGNSREQVLALREAGIPVLSTRSGSFAEIEESMRLLGRALGHPERGQRLADQLHRGMERIRAQAATQKESPLVFLQLNDQPLVTAGKATFLDEAITAAGGKNAYWDSAFQYPKPSVEDVLRKNPDVILVLALGKDRKPFLEMTQRWMRFPSLKAVRSRRIHVVHADGLLRPSLRLLEGVAILSKRIHERGPNE